MEINSEELIGILKNKIALYEHLGIEVVKIRSEEVRFRVSLEKNRNHKGTAFGGSLYASAVLAAYALVLAGLKERSIPTENIVIAKGEIQYLRPVDTDFEIVCRFPSQSHEEDFYRELTSTGRVRGSITSQILGAGGSLKASLTGVFVVKL
ncbi:YiiD C-terminal domain-containing protein [Bdellovibrio sp. BCCA]|uniref:YiiD C-terminal domain-containing protein n=1 Tax=Bdellovibrio sp. BCCA TaxID=3136281 RepID=UPI0030F15ED1